MRSVEPVRRVYESSEAVPDPGIYRVIHYQHRMPHLVTISSSFATFPSCRTCKLRVRFEPMFEVTGNHLAPEAKQLAPNASSDIDLRPLTAEAAD